MPGLVGFIRFDNAKVSESELLEISTLLKHEDHYQHGAITNDHLQVGVGWANHKGSYSDCLPIWNAEKNIALIFTGEHFENNRNNARERRATELVELYEKLGEKFFRHLNGNFCGVLLDLRRSKVFLFNDRYGLKRIYFHQTPNAYYFATEAKCLLSRFPDLRTLDIQSFGELFSCGCPLQNRTLFKGLEILPSASLITFSSRRIESKTRYFDKSEWENQSPLSEADYKEQLHSTFSEISGNYLKANETLAVSLTGGLDSRMIIAQAAERGIQLPCYTHGGLYRECEDVRVGRMVANACQQKSHEILPIQSDFFENYTNLARRSVYYTDGIMSASGASGLYMAQRARDVGSVRLTGNYGSEILRGHVAFKPSKSIAPLFVPEVQQAAAQAEETFNLERQGESTLSFIAFKQVPWHHYARYAMEDSQIEQRSPYLDNDVVALAYRAPNDPEIKRQSMLDSSSAACPSLKSIPTDRGSTNRPAIIPLKAWNWWKEFLPRAEYVYDYGMPQSFAKVDRILKPFHLEKLFLGHQKYVHYRIWYKRELAKQLKEILLDPSAQSRPYLKAGEVERTLDKHISGVENHTSIIHQLVTAEFLHRELIAM